MKKSLKHIAGRIAALLCVLCCVMSMLAGCGKKSASDGKTIKVGFCCPLTGENAKIGTEFKDAATYALEEVDYKVGEYTIEPVWVDITMDPERGTLALEQAITKDNIDVCMLSWNSSVGIAMMDVVAKYQIPYYFSMSAASSITEKYNSDPEKYSYWIGKGWPSSSYLAISYAQMLKQMEEENTWKPENKSYAVLCDETEFGHTVPKDIAPYLESMGYKMVFEDYVGLSTTDFYATLSKVKESGAVLMISTFTNPASSAALMKQADEVGLEVLTIMDSVTENAGWYDLIGDSSQYALDSRAKITTEEGLKFIQGFNEKYGYNPAATCGCQVYDYVRYFFKVVEETDANYGEVTSKSLYNFGMEYLNKGKIEFTDGIMCSNYKWDDTSEFFPDVIVGDDYYIFPVLQLMDGEAMVVWPDNVKEQDITIPDYLMNK